MTNRITLEDAFKDFTLDQDKIISPDETVRRFREKLKKIDLDILKSTVRIDNGRLNIPVYFSTCGEDAVSVIGTKKHLLWLYDKLGPLAYANPSLLLAKNGELLAEAQKAKPPASEEIQTSDFMRILCPKCKCELNIRF